MGSVIHVLQSVGLGTSRNAPSISRRGVGWGQGLGGGAPMGGMLVVARSALRDTGGARNNGK